ncbi:DUF6086 family protein, partial [Kitasatospora sp. NPDC048545]|uniref:DUF6086 family protein n=1 Tax=Kitasatospora sp. NPDC048545 TaxID=3157208 RepID=UPI0033F3AB27
MSQYYDLGDETLWNTSNGASRLFLRQVAVFEAEIGLPSGIGSMEADECQIDPAVLEVFVNALLLGTARCKPHRCIRCHGPSGRSRRPPGHRGWPRP